MREQFGLVIQLAARHRAVDAIEVCGKLQMLQNAARENRPLRGREIDPQSACASSRRGLANSRIRHAAEKPAFAVVLTIGRDGFTDPVVAI